MTRNNIKNYFVMSMLILSASGMVQNNAFATSTDLGTASTFGVLGASTVTNTGFTAITGNLGVSPGSAITGFPPGTVTGTVYTGAASLAGTAHDDAQTAYTSLAGAASCTSETGVDLGTLTLGPGVYCFDTSAQLTGTLTLDGAGVYIFQIGSTLTTASDSHVNLIGGATANNVFWQVGSSATLGTTTDFKGTIIAQASITANTGATVDGRLIALVGAVTLDTNTITVVGTGNGGTGDDDKGKHGTGDNDKDADAKSDKN